MAALPPGGPHGSAISDFEVLQEVATSATGTVLKARSRKTGRVVALKRRTTPELGRHSNMLHEVEVLMENRHPCIIECYGYFLGPGGRAVYIVLEWAPHGDLAALIGRCRREAARDPAAGALAGSGANSIVLPATEACRLCLDVARAVAHLHRRGVLHRDIKSLNVLLFPAQGGCRDRWGAAAATASGGAGGAESDSLEEEEATSARSARPASLPSGRQRAPDPATLVAKLADLGIARRLDPGAGDMARTSLGTPLYLSPEVASSSSYGPPTDVWSLGVVLHECLAGSVPFNGRSLVALCTAITSEPPPPLPSATPPPLADLCSAMLRKRPADRPTMEAVVRALAGIISALRPSGAASIAGRSQDDAPSRCRGPGCRPGVPGPFRLATGRSIDGSSRSHSCSTSPSPGTETDTSEGGPSAHPSSPAAPRASAPRLGHDRPAARRSRQRPSDVATPPLSGTARRRSRACALPPQPEARSPATAAARRPESPSQAMRPSRPRRRAGEHPTLEEMDTRRRGGGARDGLQWAATPAEPRVVRVGRRKPARRPATPPLTAEPGDCGPAGSPHGTDSSSGSPEPLPSGRAHVRVGRARPSRRQPRRARHGLPDSQPAAASSTDSLGAAPSARRPHSACAPFPGGSPQAPDSAERQPRARPAHAAQQRRAAPAHFEPVSRPAAAALGPALARPPRSAAVATPARLGGQAPHREPAEDAPLQPRPTAADLLVDHLRRKHASEAAARRPRSASRFGDLLGGSWL